MTPPRLRAVTFDLWATLALTDLPASRARHGARVEALHAALRAARGDDAAPDRDRLDRLMYREWAHYNRVWEQAQRTLSNAERLGWMLDQLGVPALPDAQAEAVCEAFDGSLWHGPPTLAPGAVEALDGLRAHGIKLGVISDTSYSSGQTLRRWLDQHGLLHRFEVLTFSGELGVSKPHPEAFLATLRALGCAPQDAAHVGDSPRTDVAGARAVGMRPIRYGQPPADAPDPDQSAPHIVHFQDLLGALGLVSGG